MNVSDVMRRSFATIRPEAPLLDGAHLLRETNQRGLPVIDREGKRLVVRGAIVIGIIGRVELLNAVARALGSAKQDGFGRTVRG
jgi:CBS domain-containing protein